MATGFAYRRGGLLGCWGLIYGPVAVLMLYNDAGATAPAILGGLIRRVSYTATMAANAYLVGVAIRWLVADAPGVFRRGDTRSDAEAS
jgi:hypothetical protein